jgi:hypothetical protein
MQNRKHLAALVCCCVLAAAFALLPAQRAGGQADSETPPPWLDGVDIVYVTETGIRYHTTDDCGNTQNAYRITAREAARLGYTPCGRCKPQPAILPAETPRLATDGTVVYLIVKDPDYHSDPTCKAINDTKGKYAPVPLLLEEAQYLKKCPCKSCVPAK